MDYLNNETDIEIATADTMTETANREDDRRAYSKGDGRQFV